MQTKIYPLFMIQQNLFFQRFYQIYYFTIIISLYMAEKKHPKKRKIFNNISAGLGFIGKELFIMLMILKGILIKAHIFFALCRLSSKAVAI